MALTICDNFMISLSIVFTENFIKMTYADEKELLLEDNRRYQCSNTKWNWKTFIGIFILLTECVCEIGSIACLQLIKDLPPNFELNSLRFAIGLILVVVYLLLGRQMPKIKKELLGWLFLGVVATYFYNLALYSEYVKELPIGAVIGIEQAFYILLFALATRILLKHKHSWLNLFLILTTFIGIGLVILSSLLPRGGALDNSNIKIGSLSSIDLGNYTELTIGGNGSNYSLKNNDEKGFNPNINRIGSAQNWMVQNLNISAYDSQEIHIARNTTMQSSNKTLNKDRNQGTDDPSWPTDGVDHTTEGVLISISLLFCAILCATTESLNISSTPLRDVNGIFLAFWYFLFGAVASALTSIMFEDIIIPETLSDRMFSFSHCLFASAVTFLYIFASKLLEPNVLAIVYSIHIPLALITQFFLMESVTPPVDIWVLVLGLIIIALSVFASSVGAVYSRNNDNKSTV